MTQEDPPSAGPSEIPYILDWSNTLGNDETSGARTALLQCLARVYTWSRTGATHTTPDAWTQALNQLPFLNPGDLQTSGSTGVSGAETEQILIDAVLSAAGATSVSAPEVLGAIGSYQAQGIIHAIQIVTPSKGLPGVSQLVATSTDEQNQTHEGSLWKLNLTTRRFLLDWPTLSSDPTARKNWDQFMDGVSTDTITTLPTYHRLRLVA